MNRPFYLAILVMLALAGCNHNFQRGVQAYQHGNYAAALADLQPAAEAGNPSAQFTLAEMHANGLGTPKNDAVAAQWYERAAEQGVVKAQLIVAQYYGIGRGVAANDAKAAKWYEKAAQQGNAEAQLITANRYATGLGSLKTTPQPPNGTAWQPIKALLGRRSSWRTLILRDAVSTTILRSRRVGTGPPAIAAPPKPNSN